MLSPEIGALMTRITPPRVKNSLDHFGVNRPAYTQTGRVIAVSETTITVAIQVDIVRHMVFDRKTGMDTIGLGTFLIRPDWV